MTKEEIINNYVKMCKDSVDFVYEMGFPNEETETIAQNMEIRYPEILTGDLQCKIHDFFFLYYRERQSGFKIDVPKFY